MYKKSNKEYKTVESLVQAWLDGHKIIHNITKCEYTFGSFMPAIRVPTQWEVHEKITDWREWVSEENPVWCWVWDDFEDDKHLDQVIRFDVENSLHYETKSSYYEYAVPLNKPEACKIFESVEKLTEMLDEQV